MGERILIVDDEPNILVSLEFLLDQEGYQVASATRGAEALQMVESFRPDLVLLDVMLPEIDGFEICRRLRARPKPPHVILLTARGRDAERVKGLDLGADLYVTKPFSTRELVADIRRCLDGALD